MRFRKSIKLLPGVKINLSNSGLSTSLGPKGATVNVKPGRKTRATVGIPGTGLSHTETLGTEAPRPAALTDESQELAGPPPPLWLSALRITGSTLKFILFGVVLAAIAAIFVALFSGNSKKR